MDSDRKFMNDSDVMGTSKDMKMKSNKIIKMRLNKLKMTQQFSLIVVVILCLSFKAPRAFVAADEDDLTTTTEFGEFFFSSVPRFMKYNKIELNCCKQYVWEFLSATLLRQIV